MVQENNWKEPVITVCFITCRKDCRIKWFFDSLGIQILELNINPNCFRVIIVDHWAEAYGDWTEEDVKNRKTKFSSLAGLPIIHVPPKPTVWSGKYRLTTQNYFSPSNSRNTGLCLAEGDYIAYVDDLSVLIPGWLEQVLLAQKGGYIACGTYRKVLKLEVERGLVKSFEDHPSGHDSRKASFTSEEPFACAGSWMFGASAAIPVEALLKTNGWDEDNDSMSGEDYCCGIMLQRNGYVIKMCPSMATLESEELHHIEPPAKRIIKPHPGYKDASHAILDWTLNGNRLRAPNYQDMRDTRDKVLSGLPFPIIQCPQHDWRDGQNLREM